MLLSLIAAIRANWTFIRYRLAEIDAGIPEAVDAGKNLRPDHAAQGLITWISTTIIDMARINCGDDSILIQRHARVTERPFVAVRTRDVVLGTSLDPLHRAATGFFRCKRANRHLRITGDLDPEAAADIKCLDANPVDWNSEMRRDELYRERRKGIVAPIVDVIVFRIPLTDNRIVLQRRAGKPVKVHLVDPDDVRRFAKRLFDVAIFEDAAPDFVCSCILVKQNGILQGLFGVNHHIE